MSFEMRCPLCNKMLSVEDSMAGQTAACPECGGEVYLDPEDAARHEREDRAQTASREVQTMRAAGIAFSSSTMPPITWGWAFDTVAKLTVAVLVIDGLIWILLYMLAYFLRSPR